LFVHGYGIPDAYAAAGLLPLEKDNEEKNP
jgi:hypothetical protein